MSLKGVGFASLPIETLIFELATDPARGVPDTPVQDRVHKSPVPDTYAHPYLTFLRRYAADVGPVGRNLPSTVALMNYEIKGVDIGYSTERIEDAAEIMDAALDGQSFSRFVDGHWYDMSVRRLSELQVELPPEEDGTVYQHLGGIYEFYVSKTT